MSTNCTNHCGACGRHFHSLSGFDLHHQRDANGWPHCMDPLDLQDRDGRPRLEALTHDGICRMYREEQRGVTVWTVAGSRERLARVHGKVPVGFREAP